MVASRARVESCQSWTRAWEMSGHMTFATVAESVLIAPLATASAKSE